jgi:hypothetical protein
MSFKFLASSEKYISSSKKTPYNQFGQFEKLGILVVIARWLLLFLEYEFTIGL